MASLVGLFSSVWSSVQALYGLLFEWLNSAFANLPGGYMFLEVLFGAGFMVLLGYQVVKFVLDIIP